MTQLFQHLQAVVFDWAGTTVDHGSRAPALVFREIFRRQGIDISMSQARGPMGLAKRDHIACILQLPEVSQQWHDQFGRPSEDADIERMYQEFLPLQKETLIQHCDVIDGIPAVVDECRQRGLKIGSSTGYTHELVDAFADRVAQQGYSPDCTLCSEDTPQGRPAPWMLFEAAKQLDVYPLWNVVKVDDTTPGIEAGRNAGCWTIGVTRTGNEVGLSAEEVEAASQDELTELTSQATARLTGAGAQFVIESVADLIPLLEEIDQRLARGDRPATT